MATKLEKFYEDKFGTPQSRGELYTGFFLIIAGFLLAILGVVIFLTSGPETTVQNSHWRATGGLLAALGPPAILMGISVTLPTKWTMRLLDGVGVLLCIVAAGGFLYLFPYNWNAGSHGEVWAAPLYVGGLAALLASTISSLIGYYVARATAGAGGAGGDVTASDYNYDIPDSVIERDIELAMRRYNVSWGGEGADAISKGGIQFDVKDEFSPGTVIGGKGVARSVTLDAPQVDAATDKLRTLRGGKGTTAVGTQEVDATTAALLAFRQKKAQLEAAKQRRGFWAWLKRLLGIKPKPVAASAVAKPAAPTQSQSKAVARPPQTK